MSKWAEQTGSNKKRWIPFLLLAALLLFFEGMFLVYGPGVYNDSEQYLQMHIHREPLYPLFLWVLRLCTPEHYLVLMGILQNLFMAVSIWLLTGSIARKFSLSAGWQLLLVLVQVFPHLMTKYFSVMSVFITNSVMSEALTFPLFTLWVMNALELLWEGKRKNAVGMLLLSILLSLTRSQMMVTVLIFFLVELFRIIFVCHKKRILVSAVGLVLVLAAAFGIRILTVRCYNLAVHGRFINNTYGNVNLVTDMIYASDREDGENIKDEQTRAFFYEIFDKAWEIEGNYQFAGSSLSQRAEHIEQKHDDIKFYCVEDTFYQYYDQNVTTDYITQNLLADEQAAAIMKGIFPKCFQNWLLTYCGIVYYGLIRSIAVVHPLINFAAMLIYASAIAATIWLWKRNPKSPAIPMMCLSLLFIAGNTAAVALTIMCLSRYMIYGFSLFYLSYLMVVAELLRTYQCVRMVTIQSHAKSDKYDRNACISEHI